MSTSTLGRIDREDRKIYYDAYLFQRRILFGCTVAIGFGAIMFLVAIASDHWVTVTGYQGGMYYVIICSRSHFYWYFGGICDV